jgi:hypothetical protein
MNTLMQQLAEASECVVDVPFGDVVTQWRVRRVSSEGAILAGGELLLHAGLGKGESGASALNKLKLDDLLMQARHIDALVCAGVVGSGVKGEDMHPLTLVPHDHPDEGEYSISVLPPAVRDACYHAISDLSQGKGAVDALARFRKPKPRRKAATSTRRKAGKDV